MRATTIQERELKSLKSIRVLMLALCLMIGFPLIPAMGQETYRTAYDLGFEDGREVGQDDRSGRKAYDFANNLLYQSATNGFEAEIHDKDVFVLAYRRGFEDGYERGYGLGGESQDAVPQPPRIDPTGLDRSCRLSEGTEIDVKLLNLLSTQRNERGDSFSAEVLEEVECDGEVVVPKGTRISGNITHLKRAGRIRGRSEMNLEFVEMALPSGVKVPISATVVSIEEKADEDVKDSEGTISGKGTATRDVTRIGAGTGIGALIGVLTGGGKGAKIGTAIGAVTGVAGTLANRGNDIVLYPDTELVIRLNREVAVSPDILRRAR
jgi:type IV secretion system protein VirB10